MSRREPGGGAARRQRLQEEADSRLLRTPFSISCSSLTEMALSCQPGPPRKKTHPSGSASTTNAAQVAQSVLAAALRHPPAGQRASAGPSPRPSPPRGGWGGEAESKHTPSAPAGPKTSPVQGGGLTSGRSASTLLPISLWGGEADMRGGGAPRASEAAHLTLTQLQPSSRRTS